MSTKTSEYKKGPTYQAKRKKLKKIAKKGATVLEVVSNVGKKAAQEKILKRKLS